MIAPPPTFLSPAEIARLELVSLPAAGIDTQPVYRFEDSKEFVTDSKEEAEAIRVAFPNAKIRTS